MDLEILNSLPSTFGLIQITTEHVVCQYLENRPIWGLREVLPAVQISWAELLNTYTNRSITEQDVLELLRDGHSALDWLELPSTDSAYAMIELLANFLRADIKLHALVPVLLGQEDLDLFSRTWYDHIAAEIGGECLPPIATPTPLPVTLVSAPRLPYTVFISAARLENDHFEVECVPVLTSSTPVHDDRFDGSVTLYVPPDNDEVQIWVGRMADDADSDEWLVAEVCGVEASQITVRASVSYPDIEPAIDLDGTCKVRELDLTRTPNLPSLPLVSRVMSPIDVAFLLDGSMVDIDYQRVKNSTEAIIHALGNDPALRFAGVVYGEYNQDVYRIVRRSDLEVISSNVFMNAHDFLRWLMNTDPMSEMPHNDCADALELGLRELLRLPWGKITRCVILVGNSPPHPEADDMSRFGTEDLLTTELRHISWRKEFKRLQETCAAANINLVFHTVWIDPSFDENQICPRSDRQMRYAAYVWHKLSTSNHPYEERQVQEVAGALQNIRGFEIRLSAPVKLPLLHPFSL